ncbi:unnamed protein product [Boreogadus saida]
MAVEDFLTSGKTYVDGDSRASGPPATAIKSHHPGLCRPLNPQPAPSASGRPTTLGWVCVRCPNVTEQGIGGQRNGPQQPSSPVSGLRHYRGRRSVKPSVQIDRSYLSPLGFTKLILFYLGMNRVGKNWTKEDKAREEDKR